MTPWCMSWEDPTTPPDLSGRVVDVDDEGEHKCGTETWCQSFCQCQPIWRMHCIPLDCLARPGDVQPAPQDQHSHPRGGRSVLGLQLHSPQAWLPSLLAVPGTWAGQLSPSTRVPRPYLIFQSIPKFLRDVVQAVTVLKWEVELVFLWYHVPTFSLISLSLRNFSIITRQFCLSNISTQHDQNLKILVLSPNNWVLWGVGTRILR